MDFQLPSSLEDVAGPHANNILIGVRPVTIRRRVLFGECDPAGVVYTPRFADYLADGYFWFMRVLMPDNQLSEQHLTTPMRGLELDFQNVLASGDWFDLQCRVSGIRKRSFDLQFTAENARGQIAFSGRLSPIIFDQRRSCAVPIPEPLDDRLRHYQEAVAEIDAAREERLTMLD